MAILTMFLVLLVGIVESTGVYFAVSDICKKEVDEKDLSKGYRAEGLAILLGGFFNAFPYTAYSQNVGLLQLSGVRTRNVVFAASGILIVLGFLPKIAAVTTVIPSSVLGGAMVAMFGMVISSGIKILSQVDLAKQENLLVIACSVGMGLGVTVVPELFKNLPESLQVLTGSGIVMGSFTAIFLNIVFNMMKSPRTQVAETKLTNEVVSK